MKKRLSFLLIIVILIAFAINGYYATPDINSIAYVVALRNRYAVSKMN